MPIDRFLNIMRQQSSLVNNSVANTALGTIVAYDQNQHYASVQLYPADPTDSSSTPMVTGMMPIFSPWIGGGWGMFSPPSIGDIVEVHFQEGNLQNGYIGMRTWNLNQAPLSVPSGEFWLVHQSGSFIKLTNDGKIKIQSGLEIDITAPIVNVNGAVNLGNLSDVLTGLMNSISIGVYNNHTHNDPQGGTTGIPNQQINPATALTTNVMAN